MKFTNVQGTKVYILPVPATDPIFVDCAAASAAIIAGDEAVCPQTLGELTRTRAITEYSCISSNDSVKAAGKISYGDFSMELLYDQADAAGQKALFDAFEANTPVIIGLVADDADISAGPTGAVGSLVWTQAMISGDGIAFPNDGLMGYSVNVAPYGGFNSCAAIPGTV